MYNAFMDFLQNIEVIRCAKSALYEQYIKI